MDNMLRSDGTRIRILRIRHGWQQQDLAHIATVRLKTVQRLEGGGNFSANVLRLLARALEVNPEELLLDRGLSIGQMQTSGLALLSDRIAGAAHAAMDICYPFLPACRMMAVSSALVMVAALAIRLSPMLVEEERETAVAANQYLPSTFSALASQKMLAPELSKAKLSPEGRVRNIQPPTPPISVRETSPINIPVRETLPAPPAVRAVQHGNHAATASGVNYMEWLTSLAETYPSTSVSLGHHVQETAPLPNFQKPRVPEYARIAPGTANSGEGAGIITRSLIKSGKSTAALFAKIGGSVKRAF
jgi:transcriptional regulator with XRE-family HTH domain